MTDSNLDYKNLYENILNENDLLKKEIETLSEHLKKYTAPTRSKKYYDQHKVIPHYKNIFLLSLSPHHQRN